MTTVTNQFWTTQDLFDKAYKSIVDSDHHHDKELLKYLEKFQQDQLSNYSGVKTKSYSFQFEKLIETMVKLYPEHGYRQNISGEGVDVDIPNFFELMFTLHYITNEIKITNNIGFDKRQVAPGISTSRKIPHVEFNIISKEIQKFLKEQTRIKKLDTIRTNRKHSVSLILDELILKLRIDDSEIKIKTFKSKSNSYHAFYKLHTNSGTSFSRSELNLDRGAKTSLNDIPKSMGLSGILRELFIEFGWSNTHRTIRLYQERKLNDDDYMRLKNEIMN